MNTRFWMRVGVPIAVVLQFPGHPAPTSWAAPRALAIRDLGTFNAVDSVGRALNDRGQVVGVAVVGPGETRGFLWDRGVMSDLGQHMTPLDINDRGQILLQGFIANPNDPNECYLRDGEATIGLGNPDGTQCHAGGLNNHGQVVGVIATYDGHRPGSSAFLWESGKLTDLGSLGGGSAIATAINDRGQVVGGSTTASFGDEHAFLWEAGEMTDFGAPGASWSRAYAINNRGQVVVQSGSHLYLWEAGSMTDLGTLGGDLTYPLGINERGQILVAVYDAPTRVFRYGIWEEGTLTWLPTLGSGAPTANRLNNRGQVVGADRTDTAGVTHVVLWTPGAASGSSDQ